VFRSGRIIISKRLQPFGCAKTRRWPRPASNVAVTVKGFAMPCGFTKCRWQRRRQNEFCVVVFFLSIRRKCLKVMLMRTAIYPAVLIR